IICNISIIKNSEKMNKINLKINFELILNFKSLFLLLEKDLI
ncbi:unnamed protein product, partial [marine sediment metagenome]